MVYKRMFVVKTKCFLLLAPILFLQLRPSLMQDAYLRLVRMTSVGDTDMVTFVE